MVSVTLHTIWVLQDGVSKRSYQSHRITLYRCQDNDAEGAADMTAALREATLRAELPSSPLASFPAIFKQALGHGILSRRRVLQRATAYQVELTSRHPYFVMLVMHYLVLGSGFRMGTRRTLK